jgi:nicotinamide mononucleotide transporter
MNFTEKLKAEFINGRTKFDWGFLFFGLLLQIIAIIYGYMTGTPDGLLSIICSISGVISVVFCAQGKISFYLFAYVQMFTYTFGIAIPNHLWGEAWENLFYFITQTWGIYAWYKIYRIKKNNNSAEVKAKKLNTIGWIITMGALLIGTTILTIVLRNTSDPQPFLDAISTIPAFIAQILMVAGYREQWLHWLIIDVASVIMFIMVCNWMMVAMFIFWTLNCIYGWYKWTKSAVYE